ncbi:MULTISPECIES: hypothetical protein [Proteus]|uniref:hypothetical protein n=1 Tax=Proteus TaxID=583 RepID=UPI0008F85A98|nr:MULTISPECIES: hypothetical protein [Proteus]MCO8052281.1 hypothetical protein [Proteus penneri]TFT66530.1 hypothetical protein E4V45_00515 [Proteus mirabilis]
MTDKLYTYGNVPHKQFPSHRDELRDKFAMAAMNGILVNTERNQFSFSETGEIASKAYELADAMLKARG